MSVPDIVLNPSENSEMAEISTETSFCFGQTTPFVCLFSLLINHLFVCLLFVDFHTEYYGTHL